MPFGLIWLLGGRRDWTFKTTPQEAAGGRQIGVPRGKMVGGSGSINSMVWFRGRAADFDDWAVPGWGWSEVLPAFEAVEARLKPSRMQGAHPLAEGLSAIFGANDTAIPTPEYESAGVLAHNLVGGRRNSAATAFLRSRPEVELITGTETDRVLWEGDCAAGVMLTDGTELRAAKGVILSAGSLASPAILMRSGLGAKHELNALGIDARQDTPQIGANLHDHPGVGLHYEGPGSGYGLEPRQWPSWALAPFAYALGRTGRFASPTVEGGAFFNARGDGGEPDVQTHFIPFFLDWKGRKYPITAGYFADVCLCRPKSRGTLRLSSKDGRAAPAIDLGLFREESDLDTMVAGVERLRTLLDTADFGTHRAPEAHPGPAVTGDTLKDHIRASAGTAYHPVGTLRMGEGDAPVTPRLAVRGTENLWVADASVMPAVTSANTNAPCMMIGYRGAEIITEDAA